jgi:aspartyl-tRNA(Asn)/glutamyl-tRNA(Gln) amidotransferase subunit C
VSELQDSGSAGSTAAQQPALTRNDVAHLAHLARLQLTESELDLYREQLDVVLHSVARVSEVAAADVEPTTHAVQLVNVYRPDVLVPSLDHAAALAAAPATDEGRFRVPQILGEQE